MTNTDETVFMLEYELQNADGVLQVRPEAPLAARDFAQLTEAVDRYLSSHDQLNGLIISTEDLPGWEDFASLVSHLNFIRDHHTRIRRVAAVTNNALLGVLPAIAGHFVAAEVRHFTADQEAEAQAWVRETPADN